MKYDYLLEAAKFMKAMLDYDAFKALPISERRRNGKR